MDREHFVVLCLNVKNQPTHINIAHIGSLNASVVHPREVFKPAILANAASIMVFHNHPSGNPEPSPEDIEVTHRLHHVVTDNPIRLQTDRMKLAAGSEHHVDVLTDEQVAIVLAEVEKPKYRERDRLMVYL